MQWSTHWQIHDLSSFLTSILYKTIWLKMLKNFVNSSWIHSHKRATYGWNLDWFRQWNYTYVLYWEPVEDNSWQRNLTLNMKSNYQRIRKREVINKVFRIERYLLVCFVSETEDKGARCYHYDGHLEVANNHVSLVNIDKFNMIYYETENIIEINKKYL